MSPNIQSWILNVRNVSLSLIAVTSIVFYEGRIAVALALTVRVDWSSILHVWVPGSYLSTEVALRSRVSVHVIFKVEVRQPVHVLPVVPWRHLQVGFSVPNTGGLCPWNFWNTSIAIR